MIYDLGGYETTRCPHRLFALPLVKVALRLYGEWKRGHLPKDGALKEQPHLYRHAMATLQAHEDQAAAWFREKTAPKKQDKVIPYDR